MEKSLLLRQAVFFIIVTFLIFPMVHILVYAPMAGWESDPHFFNVAMGALFQACLSTLFSLCFGVLGALGLFYARARLNFFQFQFVLIASLIPSFAPPLVVVVMGAKALGFMPLGLIGVIFFHCFMNLGLVSFLLFKVFQQDIGPLFKASQLSGVSNGKFVFFGLLPNHRRNIGALSFYFMILYFFSFSIPLLVGGSQFGGVEVFIYEKIVLFGEWGQAIQYSLGLFLALLALSFLFKKSETTPVSGEEKDFQALLKMGFLPGLFLCLLPVLILLWALVGMAGQGPSLSLEDLWLPIRGTLLSSLLTGAIVFVFLTLLSFSFLNRFAAKILLSMVHPGWVIVGFSFLLLGSQSEILNWFKLSTALSVLYLPFVFRLSFHQKMRALEKQVRLTEVFSVPWQKVFTDVIWPQSIGAIGFLSGLSALWAAGDFALSGIILSSSDTTTLALEMKSLISSYRLEQALLMLWPLLLCSLIVFLCFQGIGYVSRRKILS